MANSISPTYSFTLPEVGADTNAWGGHLNGNFTTIDQQMVSRTLVTAQTLAGAINLPSNGLNVGSGQLRVIGGNVTMSGNSTAVNGTFSGTLAVTGTSTLTGNTTVGGTLGVTGAATFSSTGSFTGAVTASTAPTIGGHLTNKTYVDAQDALKLNLTGGTLTGNLSVINATTEMTLTLGSSGGYYFGNATTAGFKNSGGTARVSWDISTGNFTAAGNVSGVNGVFSGTLGVTGTSTIAALSATTGTFSSTLGVTGAATFSSTVSASTAPTVGAHLTNKTYVDAQDALKLNLTGGTLTGALTLPGNPSSALQAAPKQYVDTVAANYVPLAGGTMTGTLVLPANGLNVGTGQLQVSAGNVSMSGNATVSGTLGVTGAATFSSTGSFTGNVTASTAPTLGGHLTNKTYVDAQDATKANTTTTITGTGSLTGGGDLSANRTIDVAAGGIGATQLATNAVTTIKITDLNVTTAKIADSAVTTAKIADANITAAKLDGAQSGSAPIYGARAWAYVSNNGTTASIVAAGNIASVSRTGLGIITVTFTTAMQDANYAICATSFSASAVSWPWVSAKSTTGFTIQTNTGTANIDMNFMFSVFR